MLTVHSVSEAAELAAVLAWICAAGFLAFYACDLRRVFQGGHATKPRRGRSEQFSYELVVVHNDPAVDLGRTLRDLADTFPDARVWAIAGAAGIEPGIDISAPAGSRWQVIPDRSADPGDPRGPLVRIRDTIARGLSPVEDPRRVVIGLLESGGRPEPELLDRLAARGLLAERRIGAVQLARRVGLDAVPCARRATPSLTARTLLRLQDLEERGPVSAAQLARSGHGTAILGGTGQFFRLSALDDVLSVQRAKPGGRADRPEPVRDVLDGRAVTTGLWAASWSTAYADDTSVTRRATSDLRAYVDEQRRLAVSALLGIGELIGPLGRGGSSPGKARSAAALAGPTLAPLAYLLATLIAIAAALGFAAIAVAHPGASGTFVAGGGWAAILALMVIAFGEFIVWGLAYGLRCDPTLGPIRGVGLGAAYVALGFAQAVAVWAAAVDVVRLRFGTAAPATVGGVERRQAARPHPLAVPAPTRTVEPRVTANPAGASPRRPSAGVNVSFGADSAFVLPEPALRSRRHTDVATTAVRVGPPSGGEAGPVRPRRVRTGVATDAPADLRRPVAGSGRHRG